MSGDTRPVSPEQLEPSWQEPAWIVCRTCLGDGCIRDIYDLDETCPECLGDGGREL